jgi:hypothetical protein
VRVYLPIVAVFRGNFLDRMFRIGAFGIVKLLARARWLHGLLWRLALSRKLKLEMLTAIAFRLGWVLFEQTCLAAFADSAGVILIYLVQRLYEVGRVSGEADKLRCTHTLFRWQCGVLGDSGLNGEYQLFDLGGGYFLSEFAFVVSCHDVLIRPL